MSNNENNLEEISLLAESSRQIDSEMYKSYDVIRSLEMLVSQLKQGVSEMVERREAINDKYFELVENEGLNEG
jgi:hypothetical protein